MAERYEKVKEKWRILKSKSGFKDGMLFMVFVAVSAVFWLILAFNDNAQDHFNVKLQVVNLPDTVTFISDVPERIHVVVNDKGTSLWRHGHLKKPTINIDFKEYSADGVLKYTYSDLTSALKETFGSSAQISSLSVDSLQLYYTTNPGIKVPVYVNCKVYPASGSTLEGNVKASPGSVYVYGSKDIVDTISYVSTEEVTLKDLTETTTLPVKIIRIRDVRIMPSTVTLTIPIEPLVRREAKVTVDAENVPEGQQLLLFPSKVPVEYYVAMSRFSDDEDNNIRLIVDYNEISHSKSGKLKILTESYPQRLKNLTLKTDSVEYVVERH